MNRAAIPKEKLVKLPVAGTVVGPYTVLGPGATYGENWYIRVECNGCGDKKSIRFSQVRTGNIPPCPSCRKGRTTGTARARLHGGFAKEF
jgi:hypothetical protein